MSITIKFNLDNAAYQSEEQSGDAYHDGVNYYTFRMIRPSVSEESLDRFLGKAIDGEATERDIRRYTQSLAPFVSEVYGWK